MQFNAIITCNILGFAQLSSRTYEQTMKYLIYPNLILSLGLSAKADLFPNGDFATGNDGTWEEASGAGTYVYDYPATGGNNDQYGVIDHAANDGGYGIWVANGGGILTLASLGLTAGESYNFTQDMIRLGGTDIGGFKLDFFNGPDGAGSTGDIRIDKIGDGSTWETYTYPITIPSGVDGIKAVPLWGIGSVVGYDNIGFDPNPIVTLPIPNSDFESGSISWLELKGGAATFSYPSTGGNPDGYGLIENDTNWAIWVANGGSPITLDALGINSGDIVTFQQDMRIFSGADIGTLKIEFLNGAAFLSDSGEDRPAIIGDGSTWETYSFPVTIPDDADRLKIVPVAGINSSVGFDNITFTTSPPPPAPGELTSPEVVNGSMVQWVANDDQKIHQPQFSQDEVTWINFGAPIVGDSIQEAFDPNGAPFYRVVVSEPVAGEALTNGDLELSNFGDPACADSWNCVGSQAATLITTDSFGGSNSLRLAVQNDGGASPQTSEIQQNIIDVGGSITPGETYNFSFRAKQISSGVSYVQNFRVQWLAAGGAEVPGAAPFVPFSGGNGTWDEITQLNLVAPPTAETALIQIFGATGAVAGAEAKGEVLIDELTLAPASATPDTFLTTTQTPGIGVQFPTEAGVNYRVEESENLEEFFPLGAPFVGNGENAAIGEDDIQASKYYRVIKNAIIPE